ncbi:MAG: polysaccharide deacetylase family protein [Gaiellaceae bacterium]|jgi:peptidoglycan/xylan/chitin deacetylase (PgdA/CDA1 family)
MSVIISSIKTEEPLVALTFDDGPDETYTPLLLDVLDHESAPATFFIRGSALNPETRKIVARIDGAGHDVGNHTHHHWNLAGMDAATIHEEIARTHYELEQITSTAPTLLRPPYGLGPVEVNAVAERDGYRATVLWSIYAADWTAPQPPADTIIERVLNGYDIYGGVGPGGIVLLHDGCAPEQAGESRMESVEATRKLVPALRAAGFRLVTVSELLDAGKP